MEYSAAKIAQAVDGTLLGDPDRVISRLSIDTRKVHDASKSVFFAITGEFHDGHKYIQQAEELGMRVVVCEHDPGISSISVILVSNTLRALQKLATLHRSNFEYPVIAITGSNGKTVVKEWLNQLLAPNYVVIRSPKSYNSQVGVPLSVWNMGNQHSLAIFEAGISKPGEMGALEEVLQPTLGIFTNVGNAHMENFESEEELAREKAMLFRGTKKVIVRFKYASARKALDQMGLKSVTWGTESGSDYILEHHSPSAFTTNIKLTSKKDLFEFSIPFIDEASLENALHCIVLLLEMGDGADLINARLKSLLPVNMRLELLKGKRNCQIVSDVYSADLQSLEIALDFLSKQNVNKERVVIISDILESGMDADQWLDKISKLMKDASVSKVISAGPEFQNRVKNLNISVETFDSTDDILSFLEKNPLSNSDILVKGARKYKFERIVKALEAGVNGTVMEINLNALTDNLNYYRTLLSNETKLMVMVKAFAYGSGAHEIARVLEFNQVHALGVAFIDEGISLREAGVSLPILVLNPEASGFEELIRNRLEPEIFNLEALTQFVDTLENGNNQDPYPIHLKIDTGMHRLGFDPADLSDLLGMLKKSKHVRVSSVFSHLAASDETLHDGFTSRQISLFSAVCGTIEHALGYHFDRHILNTAGIEKIPKARFEMVRLGIGLYGISTTAGEHLRQVAQLKSRISQIREVPDGESVGYNRSYIAKGTRKIATVPIGYADGFNRRLSNGVGSMFINGSKAPIAGNVCMDMTMVDVTNIECEVGDEVEIFGDNIPISELADNIGTIVYEVITGISLRVRRVFVED